MGIFDRFLSTKSERKFALMIIDRLKQAGDDRDIRYEAQSFRLLFSDHGQPIGYASNSKDVTQTTDTQLKVQQSREHLMAMIETLVRRELSGWI